MQPLDERVVCITGASAGIGAAIAKKLAAMGASVVLGARRVERVRAVADSIEATGGRALARRLDVSDERDARAFVDFAVARCGAIDALVNCAGVELVSLVARSTTEMWRTMVDVNLMGVLHCTRSALPHLLDRGRGDIVNISSVAGRVPSFGGAVYSATKFGVNGFSEALRQEVAGAGVRVIVIEPGFVATELHEGTPDLLARDALQRIGERIGEVLQPEDVAESVAYALAQPRRVSLNEIVIRPTAQRI